jgi:hydrogenase maturation factor HypF (carbamoyltransferase family)
MSELAEDIFDGTCCSLCGQYFQDPKNSNGLYVHGEPVVCKDCWKDLDLSERKNYKKAVVDTI